MGSRGSIRARAHTRRNDRGIVLHGRGGPTAGIALAAAIALVLIGVPSVANADEADPSAGQEQAQQQTEESSSGGTAAQEDQASGEEQPQADPSPSPSPSLSSGGNQDLTLVKDVVNDDGGKASAGDWSLQVSLDGDTWKTLAQGVPTPLAAGTYHLRETGGPAGYTLTDLTCDSYTWDPEARTITLRDGDHNTCTFTNDDDESVDVGIVKTSSTIPAKGVDYGEEFSWFLTVTNVGPTDASDAVVTDELPEGVTVQSVIVPAGWTDESAGSSIRVVIWSLPVGASDVIEVKVTVDEQPTVDAPFLPPGSKTPTLTVPSDEFVNTACVRTPKDANPENDCDTNKVPRKILAANVWVSCINDAPFLQYQVAVSDSLKGMPITLTWLPASAAVPASKVVPLTAASGRIDWPGVKWDADGVSYDWPGWRPLRPSDFGPDGLPLPGLEVYGDSVRDPSEPDEGWRQPTTVTISVNPHVTFNAVYPPATPQCAVKRVPRLAATGGDASGAGALGLIAALLLFGGAVLVRAGRRHRV